MENHARGYVCTDVFVQNHMGAVLYLGSKHPIRLKRSTNRKAKYDPSFFRVCIGFFCTTSTVNKARSPPLKVFNENE